jgi:hypothetical protein
MDTGALVRLSWTEDERAAIRRQDEEYRLADATWALNHGPVAGGAVVVPFATANAPQEESQIHAMGTTDVSPAEKG